MNTQHTTATAPTFPLLPPAEEKRATGAADANGGGSTGRRRVLTDLDYLEMLGPNVNGRKRHGEWFDLAWAHFGDACAYCQGLSRILTGPYGYLCRVLDHFTPESEGGPNARHNLIPACHYCNSVKGRRDALAWYRAQPFHTPEREARILAYMEAAKAWG